MLPSSSRRDGFTLVELSIVLVIIGLLLGGVLLGRDLIRSGEIRSQVSDLESYQTGVGTFAMRFSGIPGDLKNARDVLDVTQMTTIANGDGDGYIEDGAGTTALFTGEISQFWMQLSAAKLVEGTFSDSGVIGKSFPLTASGRGGVVARFDTAILSNQTPHQANIFFLGMTGTVAPGTIVNAASFYPEDAWKIDEKIDDGKPYFGMVRARNITYRDPDYLDVLLAPDQLPAPIQFVFKLLVPGAHAMGGAGTSVAEDKACVYVDDDTASSVNTATYAFRSNAINCNLSVEIKH